MALNKIKQSKRFEYDELEELSDEQLEELLNVTHQEMPEDSLSKIKNRVHQTIQQAEKNGTDEKKSQEKMDKNCCSSCHIDFDGRFYYER